MNLKGRMVHYDLMRVIACLFVIMIHSAVCDQMSLYENNTLAFQASNIWGVLARWAVPAFVMLSGMMFLRDDKETNLKDLYKRKVLIMFTAYIFWSAIYSCYNVFVLGKLSSGTALKSLFDGCFSGELHMWYILMAAGLYIASPIIKVLLHKLSKKLLIYWVVAMLVFGSIIPMITTLKFPPIIEGILDTFNRNMDLQFFCGWTLYFVLGYLIQNHNFTSKERKIIYTLAIISFVFTMFFTVGYSVLKSKSLGVLPYEYPNIVFMSVGILLFFKETVSKIKFGDKAKKVIVTLSSLTFGIYLSHVLILKVLYTAGINLSICNPIISIPVISIIIFVLGGCLSWLLLKIPLINKYIA
ncbi:MAG TPA: acyltransferase family protein [Clostridiales bacterium]|nr:acyltransferase family protein [Clostridiales bacterium]